MAIINKPIENGTVKTSEKLCGSRAFPVSAGNFRNGYKKVDKRERFVKQCEVLEFEIDR